MSAPKSKTAPAKPKSFGWMAEYDNADDLLTAAKKVRDSGYTKTDAYTPFPVHGIDKALGIKQTVLPFIVLTCGITGLILAITFQCWSNGIDYAYIISGKPFFSIPAFIPVTFETTVLFSAFSTFFGMWALNRLPTLSNALFAHPRFDRVTNDRFFLHVDSRDKFYNRESVRELLGATSPLSLEEVVEDSTPDKLPAVVWMGVITLITASLIPLAIVANMRAGRDDRPRWHVFFDMDFQPKKKAQSTTTIFADGRTARPQVPGTVARGQLEEQDPYYLGYDPAKVAAAGSATSVRLVSVQDGATEKSSETPKAPALEGAVDDSKPVKDAAPKNGKGKKAKADAAKKEASKSDEAKSDDAKPADNTQKSDEAKKSTDAKTASDAKKPEPPSAPAPAKVDAPSAANTVASPASAGSNATSSAAAGSPAGPNLPWVTDFPTPISEEMLALGKAKFEITCSVCHGYAGQGDGLVHRRAEQLQQGYWLPPTSLHEKRIQDQAVGNIFYTITNGKGKMAGYGTVLTPKERWAIVMYVRALQRSRDANINDVPVDQRAKLEETKAE